MVQLSRRHLFHQNFQLIYSTYRSFHAQQSVASNAPPLFTEHAALKAFEHLLSQQHLLVWAEHPPTDGPNTDPAYTGRAVQRRFLPVKMLLTEHEFKSALKQRVVEAPTWLVLWANNRND
jgi:hypothetical protein